MSSAGLFDRLRDRYDSWYDRNRVIAESEARLVESMIRWKPVVEIGVGTGWFASRVDAVAGVDPSWGMLEAARRRLPDALLVQGIGEKLPLASGVFGTALIVVTICFADDPEAMLSEAARVVRDGGDVVVCIVPAESPWGRYYSRLAGEGHPFYSLARFVTMKWLQEAMRRAGLSVDQVLGVLSFKPWEEPVLEEPMEYREDLGFACARGVKGVSPGPGSRH